jgi:hypothetical protein
MTACLLGSIYPFVRYLRSSQASTSLLVIASSSNAAVLGKALSARQASAVTQYQHDVLLLPTPKSAISPAIKAFETTFDSLLLKEVHSVTRRKSAPYFQFARATQTIA